MKKELIQLSAAIICLLMTTVAISAQTTLDESQVTILRSISSTGTQAFNTGYTHKANTRVVMDCEVTQNSQHHWESLLGARLGDQDHNAFYFFSRTDGSDIPCFCRTGNQSHGTGFVYGERIILTCEGQTATWKRYSNPNTVAGSVTTSGTADEGKTPMFLFNLNTSSTEGGIQTDGSLSVMKLYSCLIYEGSTLKCDFVPALYDATAGLYDRVNHTFSGSITPIPFETDDIEKIQLNYKRALAAIENGHSYRVYTIYNNAKYYVTANGYLSKNKGDAPLFQFNMIRPESASEYEYGFMLKNGSYYFTNPAELDESALTIGHLNTTNENARDTWEAQVFFLNAEGKYAIRSTNTKFIDDPSRWAWIGSAFWTVNQGTSGPLAEYSFDMNYVWQLEADTDELLINGQCDGSFEGWTKTDGGNGWGVGMFNDSYYWASSHQVCTLSQTITLADCAIGAQSIDNGEVTCSASADILTQFESNGSGSRVCEVTVQMLDANDAVLATETVLNDTGIFTEWTTFSTEFTLVTGTRKLKYEVKGQDAVNWAGQFGPCFKNLSLKTIGATVDDITANYLRALNTIENGECYRVFTMYNGQKYYVTADGHLSTNVDDAPSFGFIKAAGEAYEYGFKLNNGDTYFTNPKERTEESLTMGSLNTTNVDARNTWEAQVFFLNPEGKYAIRSTNVMSSDDQTSWAWVAKAFWTVNEGTGGPLAEYSWDMNYVWQLEKGENNALLPVWVGSQQVSLFNKDDVLGNGTVRYIPDEGKGTLTFTTSTPNINGVHSNSKIYAEGIDLTICAPSELTISGEGANYGIYVANEGALTINANFKMTTGVNALWLENGDLTINGSLHGRTTDKAIFVRKGDVRITGDVDVKTNNQSSSWSIGTLDGYVHLGPGTWEIESVTGTIHADKKVENANPAGGIMMPFTHEIYNAENPLFVAKVSDDKRGITAWDGNGGWKSAKHVIIRKEETEINPSNTIDLSTLTADCVIPDNTRVTGTLNGFYKVSIADGATVSLRDVNINLDPSGYDEVWDTTYRWAGITCEGDATIFLENTNTVKGFCNEYPGIYVPEGKTLIIHGSGTLNAISGGNPNDNVYSLLAPGIGGGLNMFGGNIIINEGTITATGGKYSAGIGSGFSEDAPSNCGFITINGGTVAATGGDWAAGIGSGASYEETSACGNITINGGTVTATAGDYAAAIGSGIAYEANSGCGNITITGGTVTAIGGHSGAGIGSGLAYEASSGCGDITISGGTVTATAGDHAAAIGSGVTNFDKSSYCGDITITNGIEKVVAIAKFGSVGAGFQGTCGGITIGDNLGSEEKKLDDGFYSSTFQAKEKIKYPLWIGDTQVTYLNKDNILGDGSVSFRPFYETNTLTFTKTPGNISGLTYNAVIAVDGIDLTIVAPSNGLTLNSSSYGIWINGDNKKLTINGDLSINSAATGISTFNSGVDITINGKFTFNSPEFNGIWTPDGAFTINGELQIEKAYTGVYANQVNINGNLNAKTTSKCIYANGDVTINGDIIAEGSTAIRSEGNIKLVSGNVNLTGTEAAMDADGTISIPASYRISTPAQGKVMQKNGHTYVVDPAGNIASNVVIQKIDCDINGDNLITIADVTALVNIILGKSTEGQFRPQAADVNGDGLVTIADVTALVNIILGK